MPHAQRLPWMLTGCLLLAASLAGAAEIPAEATPSPDAKEQQLADTLAAIVRSAIPHEYERRKDWGRTKRITTGIVADGPVYRLKLHRRKKHVDHGTWKQYRVRLVDPDQRLRVRVEQLRSLDGGGMALRLVLEAELDGWAQMRRYNRGVHLITLTAEGTSQLRLAIDCQVRLAVTSRGVALDPTVTAATLDLKEFELHRLGEVEGKLAAGLGKGLKHLVEDELDGPRLVAKLNRAIDKKRDRLTLSPGGWLPTIEPHE